MNPTDPYEEFTEDGYRRLLAVARERYSFEPFATSSIEPHVLWRHDIDFSVHQALRIAQIEADEGVRATYLFLLHSSFYNLLENETAACVRAILRLGHWFGLHFDTSFYDVHDLATLEVRLEAEKAVLEHVFEVPVGTLSFHNPDFGRDDLAWSQNALAGMRNAYGRRIREQYTYLSDSNGYWRFQPAPEVLTRGEHLRLHVLTHPAWWTPEPMPPRARIARCVDQRAIRTMKAYDALLEQGGRQNIS